MKRFKAMNQTELMRFYWLGGHARPEPRGVLARMWRHVHDFIAPLWMRPTLKQWVANLDTAAKAHMAQVRAGRLAGPEGPKWREYYRGMDTQGRPLPYPDEVEQWTAEGRWPRKDDPS